MDLVCKWEPNPILPHVRAFLTKSGVQGWAQEDGETLHIIEMWAEKPGFPRIMGFIMRCRRTYKFILIEKPRARELIQELCDIGFTTASIKTFHDPRVMGLAVPDKVYWNQGMVWGSNMPMGVNTDMPRRIKLFGPNGSSMKQVMDWETPALIGDLPRQRRG